MCGGGSAYVAFVVVLLHVLHFCRVCIGLFITSCNNFITGARSSYLSCSSICAYGR